MVAVLIAIYKNEIDEDEKVFLKKLFWQKVYVS